jgi:alkaline phosphatase D
MSPADRHPVSRRRFLRSTLGGATLLPALAPAIVMSDRERPAIPYGVASGDVGHNRAVVWSRSDRPARMVVEYASSDSFRNARRIAGPIASLETGFTARVELTDLPPGQRMFYRVVFEDPSDSRLRSAAAEGSFRSAPAAGRDVTIAWGADTAGQGWGINPDWGGMQLYETMRRAEPDVFVHCGDTVYADQPLAAQVPLDGGDVWRNLVTDAKSKVAETLDEFRGNYLYNLLDENVRRFNAAVPQIVIWDDHEVRDNWYRGRSLEQDDRYREKDIGVLIARARQAFVEHFPVRPVAVERRLFRTFRHGPLVEIFVLDMRNHRGPNTTNRQPEEGSETVVLGEVQREWFRERLAQSTATWKVIVSSLPIGLVVRDGPEHFEAIANGDPGVPLGRELVIADLLRFIRDRRVRNTVWLTGDVHYAAAHHYDPARARFTEFAPFWEFVAGPIHAGTFGPNPLDATFGPEVKFHAVPDGMKPNRPPSAGLQFFGTARVEARTQTMTVRLHDLSGRTLYEVTLEP